jgi:uncharacterized protein (TIGR02598 family)
MRNELQANLRGFSLVEVTLALGIVAFAFITLFALLPTGLRLVRESSDEGVAVNILTALAADLKNSDGVAPITQNHQIPIDRAGVGVAYFDESGRFLGNNSGDSAIYKANWSVRSRDVANGVPPGAWLKISWPAASESSTGSVETLVIFKVNPADS